MFTHNFNVDVGYNFLILPKRLFVKKGFTFVLYCDTATLKIEPNKTLSEYYLDGSSNLLIRLIDQTYNRRVIFRAVVEPFYIYDSISVNHLFPYDGSFDLKASFSFTDKNATLVSRISVTSGLYFILVKIF